MSIFLDLIKAIVDYELTEWQKKSVSKDKGYFNVGLSAIGYGRNPELSKTKRSLADGLIAKIKEFQSLSTDEENLESIRKLLTQTQGISEKEHTQKLHAHGTLEPLLEKLRNYIDAIYMKLDEVRLLDIQSMENDPYSVLCQLAACYYAEKIHDQKYNNSLTSIINNPKLSSNTQLTQNKDTLLQNSLLECVTGISCMDKQSPWYQQVKKRRVLECIDSILVANEELCQGAGITVKVPLFSKAYVKFQPCNPNVGCLEYYMTAAKETVEKIVVPNSDLKLVLNTGEHSEEHWVGLIRAILIEKLTKWRENSMGLDKGLVNKVVSKVVEGRDLELSNYKQKLAQTVIDYLGKPEVCNSLNVLERILVNAEKNAAQTSAQKDYSEGSFGETITQCINLVKAIHAKLESIGLLNITSKQDEPFDVFCYGAAEYIVRKVYSSKNNRSILNNPQITNITRLTTAKETLLLSSIQDLALDLAILDKNIPQYMSAKQERTLNMARTLLKKNEQLCQKYGYMLPFSEIGFGSVHLNEESFVPGKGELDDYVKKIIKVIEKNKVEQPLMLQDGTNNTNALNRMNNTNTTSAVINNYTNTSSVLSNNNNNTNTSSSLITPNVMIYPIITNNSATLFYSNSPKTRLVSIHQNSPITSQQSPIHQSSSIGQQPSPIHQSSSIGQQPSPILQSNPIGQQQSPILESNSLDQQHSTVLQSSSVDQLESSVLSSNATNINLLDTTDNTDTEELMSHSNATEGMNFNFNFDLLNDVNDDKETNDLEENHETQFTLL